MKKILSYISALAAATLLAASCAEPEFPEGDSACTLSALKVYVYDAEGKVVGNSLDALSGMYDAESGAASYRFPATVADVSRCRLEASIPSTATVEETDAMGEGLGHGLGGIRSLENVTVYFKVKAANGKDFKNYQITFRI